MINGDLSRFGGPLGVPEHGSFATSIGMSNAEIAALHPEVTERLMSEARRLTPSEVKALGVLIGRYHECSFTAGQFLADRILTPSLFYMMTCLARLDDQANSKDGASWADLVKSIESDDQHVAGVSLDEVRPEVLQFLAGTREVSYPDKAPPETKFPDWYLDALTVVAGFQHKYYSHCADAQRRQIFDSGKSFASLRSELFTLGGKIREAVKPIVSSQKWHELVREVSYEHGMAVALHVIEATTGVRNFPPRTLQSLVYENPPEEVSPDDGMLNILATRVDGAFSALRVTTPYVASYLSHGDTPLKAIKYSHRFGPANLGVLAMRQNFRNPFQGIDGNYPHNIAFAHDVLVEEAHGQIQQSLRHSGGRVIFPFESKSRIFRPGLCPARWDHSERRVRSVTLEQSPGTRCGPELSAQMSDLVYAKWIVRPDPLDSTAKKFLALVLLALTLPDGPLDPRSPHFMSNISPYLIKPAACKA